MFHRLFFKDRDYQKFIIIARSRTGSNLLRSLLNSNPEIEAQHEAFRDTKTESCREIWDSIFVKKDRRLRYVGFKIFYYHPLESTDREVWDFIENDRAIKVIHLTRKNVLRTIVSRKIAGQTDIWINKNPKEEGLIPLQDRRIELDIKKCLKAINQTGKWEKEARERFSKHPVFELTYEELTAEPQKTMNKIYSFFNVKTHPVTTKTRRQNPEKISDLITNYDEVSTALITAGYSEFLEEN